MSEKNERDQGKRKGAKEERKGSGRGRKELEREGMSQRGEEGTREDNRGSGQKNNNDITLLLSKTQRLYIVSLLC